MNIVNRLNMIKALQAQIDIRTEELNSLRSKACDISGRTYNQIRVQNGKNLHRIEDLVAHIDELEKELAKQQYALSTQRQDILEYLSELDPLEFRLMGKRYVLCKKWEDISEELHICIRHCHRLHSQALKHLQEIYNQPAS